MIVVLLDYSAIILHQYFPSDSSVIASGKQQITALRKAYSCSVTF